MPGEDHRLDVLVARKRRRRRAAAGGQGVADAEARHVLQAGDDVSDLAGGERLDRSAGGREHAELLGVELGALRHRAERLARLERSRRRRGRTRRRRGTGRRTSRRRAPGPVHRAPGRRRDPLDDRVEQLGNTASGLRGDPQHAIGRLAEEVAELARGASGSACGRSILFAAGTTSRPPSIARYAFASVCASIPCAASTTSERTLARLQRARDLVREVHVTRRVDEVQLVAPPVHADGLGLDRDAALALELHRVEELLAHLALAHGASQLEHAIGERRLAMVDVRDDREVANAVLLHRSLSAAREARRAGIATVATSRARADRAPAPGPRTRARRRRTRGRVRRSAPRCSARAAHRGRTMSGTRGPPRPRLRGRLERRRPSVRPTCSRPNLRRIITRRTTAATTFTVEVASGIPQIPSR